MNTLAPPQLPASLLVQLPERLQIFLETHHGLVTQQQLLEAGLPAHWLAYYTNNGLLERTQRGLYRQIGSEGFTNENLLEVALRVPQGVICSLSALAFHNLGTVHLAIPNKARRPHLTYPPLELYYFSPKSFGYGIEQHRVGSGIVRVYSKEKTLADILHLERRIERGVFLEVLKAYLASKDRDIDKLLETAKVRRVEPMMRLLAETVLA
jgi:predicted transcriptional regulator of viral defense system